MTEQIKKDLKELIRAQLSRHIKNGTIRKSVLKPRIKTVHAKPKHFSSL